MRRMRKRRRTLGRWDGDTGSTYYYNHISGESVWKSEDKEEETRREECHDEETGLTLAQSCFGRNCVADDEDEKKKSNSSKKNKRTTK